MPRLMFSHCPACALNDEGTGPDDPGVGCPSDGPADGCEAVWIEVPRPRCRCLGNDFDLPRDQSLCVIDCDKGRPLAGRTLAEASASFTGTI